MAARERTLTTAIQTVLNAATFTPAISVEVSFLPVYDHEEDYGTTQVNVSPASRTQTPSTRTSAGFGRKTIDIVLVITRKAAIDSEAWIESIDVAEDIEDAIRSYNGKFGGCSWMSSETNPLYDIDLAQNSGVFQQVQVHTFEVTETKRA